MAAKTPAQWKTLFENEPFHRENYYTGPLGPDYTPGGTCLRLWAPTAEAVTVTLYHKGDGGAVLGTKPLVRGAQGVWSVWLPGEQHGRYYTFAVTVNGITRETGDPYARAAGVNGVRSMIVDLARTAPSGWERDVRPAIPPAQRAVWEVSVRDFSQDAASGVRPAWRGKYMAFTQQGRNVCVCAVRGNFDDAQTGVKDIFAAVEKEHLLAGKGVRLSSANSINIGRLAPQVVYYFRSYAELCRTGRIQAGDKVDFAVPTGNFGDILAGYFARELGLPVGRLICASNANDVLTDFLHTGRYDRNRPFYKTVSPSMDILVSSNLERLLYLMSGDAALVAELMAQLKEKGVYQVPDALLEKIQSVFWSGCCDDDATKAAIGRLWKEHHYLADTHTAVAWQVAQDYKAACAGHNPVVVLSTASPYKFPAAVLEGLGEGSDGDEFDVMAQLHDLTGVPVPANLQGLRQREVLHRDVIDREDMLSYVLKKAGEAVWSK